MVMGFAILTGIFVATQGHFIIDNTLIKIPLSFTTGFTFLAAANAINDYYDRDIDAINEPNRPIPSGIIRPSEALSYAFILSAIGFITAFMTSSLCLIIALLSWILSIYYATKGKRTGLPGNIIVSACVALPFIYGGFVVKEELNLILIMFSFLAFLSNTGREITKGIVDVEGDRITGIKTIAVVYGLKIAAFTAVAFYIASITTSLFPWILGMVTNFYLPLIVLVDVGVIFLSISLIRNQSRKNAKRVKNLVLFLMMIALLGFATAAFTGY
jgi:geranylgeranylglycerol-phosphate geranylgeranyltransferase